MWGTWLVGVVAMTMAGALFADHAGIQLISQGWMWDEADGSSEEARVSPCGKFVAFISFATNLEPGIPPGLGGIYLHDVDAERTFLVSTNSEGELPDNECRNGSVSKDGRFVVFASFATDLVTGDTNGCEDIFVKDTVTGLTERVSVSSAGIQANGESTRPSISADGRYVAFQSGADNLVAGDDNWMDDIFVHDRKSRKTWRVSVNDAGEQSTDGSQNVRISGDGKWVVFESMASNLVDGDTNGDSDVFIRPTSRAGIVRLSVSAGGAEGNSASANAAVSTDGRYVAFDSWANNLVAGDTNDSRDVFLVDRELGTIVRASVNTAGTQGNADSETPAVDDTGRVVFVSMASNLEDSDDNGSRDIFIRWADTLGDMRTNMISRTPENEEPDSDSQLPSISADGTMVAFVSHADDLVFGDSNISMDAFFRTIGTNSMGDTKRANVTTAYATNGNGGAYSPDISSSGRYVVFAGTFDDDNLVYGDTNGFDDIFRVDRWLGTISRINMAHDGAQANGGSEYCRISPNGQSVVFTSEANNLVEDDTNPDPDIFLWFYSTPQHLYQVLGDGGVQPNGACYEPAPADNRNLAFASAADNLVAVDVGGFSDVFYTHVVAGTIEMVSVGPGGQGNSDSESPSITPDARYVAFSSRATNLIDGGTVVGRWHVYVRDRTDATTEIVSVSDAGADGDSNSSRPSISADGRYVAFESVATNLVAGDTNGLRDIFVFDRNEETVVRASVASDGTQANGHSYNARISPDGRYVTYESAATNLVTGDTNGVRDVFVHDLRSGRTVRVSLGGPMGTNEADAHCQSPAISDNGRHVVFSTAASLVSSVDDNGLLDIYCILNHQPALAPGMTFPLTPGEVDGFADATFGSKPKMALAYEDPVKFVPARKSAKLRPAVYPVANIEGEWTAKVSLLDRKSFTWKNRLYRDARALVVGLGNVDVVGDLLVGATQASGVKVIDADAGEKVLVPPYITLVRDSLSNEVTDTVQAGDELQVNGGFFGPKPKAWLEYVDAKGKFKQLKCKVAPGRQNAAGKNSCMSPNGNSAMWITLPAKWPKGWVHTRHDLVIDNGCGRAFSRLLTE
jgi:Tol biopolymer transport system component